MEKVKITTVDAYMVQFPQATQDLLWQMHALILETAPDAQEVISYGMPAFKYKGKVLVYYAGYKGHIGFYPASRTAMALPEVVSTYKTSTGTIQFPLDKPLPTELIRKIVGIRMMEVEGSVG